jgi:hypothetical protein
MASVKASYLLVAGASRIYARRQKPRRLRLVVVVLMQQAMSHTELNNERNAQSSRYIFPILCCKGFDKFVSGNKIIGRLDLNVFVFFLKLFYVKFFQFMQKWYISPFNPITKFKLTEKI